MEQNTPQDAERQIALAEAQILGFIHGRGGYSLASLVESMGLKHSEWLVIKEDEKINHNHPALFCCNPTYSPPATFHNRPTCHSCSHKRD